MRRTQKTLLLPHSTRLDLGDAGSESYSSNSSYTDSFSDSSDLANWEEHVATDGSLFYAEYLPHVKKQTAGNESGLGEKRVEFTRSTSLRMMSKKQARRQQHVKSNGQQRLHEKSHKPQLVEHKFSHIGLANANATYKQLELVITAADRFRFGRRSTPAESILGIQVVSFPDQPECLMVEGFVHDMPALQPQQDQRNQAVQQGDWFKSLNDIEVRASNLNELLLQFTEPTKVCLKFQGVSATEHGGERGIGNLTAGAGGSSELQKVENFDKFSSLYAQLQLPQQLSADVSQQMLFALLILPPECYQQDEHRDSLYYYPENVDNFLYKTRGSFLTLNAVLSEELQTRPLNSQLLVEQQTYYVSYRKLNGFLVLFAYAASYQTLPEANLRSDELIAYMRFAFPTLSLEHFANVNASATELRRFLRQFCEVQRVRILDAYARTQGGVFFEELLKESRQLCLPKEAQLRIFDALSEMEAMDYRNWNDEPLSTHREFFMYGSVLYYDHFLLASQMPVDVRARVECFLRCRAVFDFVAEQCVKELYIWQEISLPNATGRYFLTVCSRSHLILAAILKIFDPPDLLTSIPTIPPSLFYIEEIQETLDHLIQCGIESLAMLWSVSNKRPEVLDKVELPPCNNPEKDTSKLETFLKQKLSVTSTTVSERTTTHHDDEAQHLCSSLGGSSSIHSLTPSEDDSSRKRLTMNNSAEDSDSGGSDWDNFCEQNPLHYGGVLDADAPTQVTESLWKEINNVVPVKISAGWKNAIFYYVYVDTANGSTFCPLKANSEAFPFLREMRKACHQIHAVLQQTKHFRRLLAQESSKPNASRGLLSIKEHGMTIQVREPLEPTATAEGVGVGGGGGSGSGVGVGVGGAIKGQFVVVGRLFSSPTKEVYVCHRPDVPQNMVELAFRLSFFSVG